MKRPQTTPPAVPELSQDDTHAESSDATQTAIGAIVSGAVHTVVLLILALVSVDMREVRKVDLVALPPKPVDEDPPVEIELDPEIEVVPPETATLFSAAPAAASPAAKVASTPVLDQSLVSKAVTSDLVIDAPTADIPDSMALIESVPDAANRFNVFAGLIVRVCQNQCDPRCGHGDRQPSLPLDAAPPAPASVIRAPLLR